MNFNEAVKLRQSINPTKNIGGLEFRAIVTPKSDKDFKDYLEGYQLDLEDEITDEMAMQYSSDSQFSVIYFWYENGEALRASIMH